MSDLSTFFGKWILHSDAASIQKLTFSLAFRLMKRLRMPIEAPLGAGFAKNDVNVSTGDG